MVAYTRKKGQQHKDTPIRNFFDTEDYYLDKWDLLGLHRIKDNEVSKDIYSELVSYIPKLEGIEYGKVYPEVQTGDGSMEHPFQIPYMEYTDVVKEFEKAVYKFEEEYPEYELNSYIDVMLREGIAWDEEVMMNVDIRCINGQVTMALLMACIRAEKFCSGALNAFLKSGYVKNLLLHLKELSK